MKNLIFGILVHIVLIGHVLAEPSQNKIPIEEWRRISIVTSAKKLITLEALHKLAEEAIQKRNSGFKPENFSVSFYFYPGSSKKFVRVDFFQGFGKTFWSVCYTKEGKIRALETGTAEG